MTQLARRHPFQDMAALRERMDRLFGESYGPTRGNGDVLQADWLPAVDVMEDEDAISVRAELPGMTEEDVSITIENGRLVLKGEKKREHEEEKGDYRRIESYYGSFYRSFPLPTEVDTTKIAAQMKNGVLEIALPKTEMAKPRKIEVKAT